MAEFKDKILMITGGTGSFGNAVLERFLDTDIKEIRIFSRDEKRDHRKEDRHDADLRRQGQGHTGNGCRGRALRRDPEEDSGDRRL